MKKSVILLILLVITKYAEACSCVYSTITSNFYSSDFVAEVKILNTSLDPNDHNSTFVEVEVLKLYKGKKTTRFKINSGGDSCSFNVTKNSIWLIFSNSYRDNMTFHYCSGSQKSPGSNLKSEIKKLKKYPIITKDTSEIKSNVKALTIHEKFENLPVTDFAIVEYTLGDNLQLNKMKLIKKFKNNNLTNHISDKLLNEINFSSSVKVENANGFKVYYLYEYIQPPKYLSEVFLVISKKL